MTGTQPRTGRAAPAAAARAESAPGLAAAVGPDTTPGRFRLIDRLFLFYFVTNSLLLLLPGRPDNWPVLLAFHLVYLVGIPLAVRFARRSVVLARLRDWYPLLGLVGMYLELQELNRILTDRYFDDLVQRWEIGLFGQQMAETLHLALPWKWLGEAVHFGYFTYYLIAPTFFIPLWWAGKRAEFRVAMAVTGAAYLFCYVWYIYFPVTGPYWQFTPPDPDTLGWYFPQLTHGIVSRGSSRGSAFPSSHVAATVTVLGMAWRYHRPIFWILLGPVVLLSLGTVYGGFHYAVDAVAGLVVGLAFAVWMPGIVRAVDGAAADTRS